MAVLDEIIVSLDGVDQETYAKYRVGGQIERVFDGVRRLVAAKQQLGAQTPLINLQFIVMKHNEHDCIGMRHVMRTIYKNTQEAA